MSRRWTALSPNGRRRKTQHQTRNSQNIYWPERKRQDWFYPNDQELQSLMSRRDQAHQRVFQTRSTRSTNAAYKDACRMLQKIHPCTEGCRELLIRYDGLLQWSEECVRTQEEGICLPEINIWNGDLL